MADKLPMIMPWPVSGVDKSMAWRDQKVDTCISALNVRNIDGMDSRVRGGTRPGLCNEYATALGSGNPVRMLGRVALAKDSTRYRFLDDFNRDVLGSTWTTASWIGVAPSVKASYDGTYADNATSGAVAQALNFATTGTYKLSLYVMPWLGAHWGTYSIFARMDNTTPVATTDGIVVSLALSGATGVYSGTLKSYVSGVETSYNLTGGNQTVAKPAWFDVSINSNTITVQFDGVTLLTQAVSAHTGKRVGFGLSTSTALPTGMCLCDCFRVLGAPLSAADSPDYTEYLCAISNGVLNYENNLGVMGAATGDPNDFSSDRSLRCVELFQKLYIADWSEAKKIGSASGSTDGAGTVLDDSGVTDWTTLGIDKDTDVVYISAGTGGTVIPGVYEISSIHSTNGITLTTSSGTNGSSIDYRIARCPKVFTPSTGAVTRLIATAGKGQVPNECPLIAVFRDRLVFGGHAQAPHVWYMSKRGDPLDWDYSTTTAGRAYFGTTDGGTGTIGLPLTAMFSASNDSLVMASKSNIMVLRGDPTQGGQFDCISNRIGIVGAGAWAKGPNDETFFLSRDGIYVMPAGETSAIQSLSRQRLPNDLIDVDTTAYDVLMMYNVRQQGVHIWLTYKNGIPVNGWFFDVKRGAFWPESLPATQEVFSAIAMQVNTVSQSELILGCRDGFLRRYNAASQSDSGTAISSYAWMGPYRMSGDDYREGQLVELDGILDRDSGPVTWGVYVGKDNEDVWNAVVHTTDTWSATGMQYRRRPMASGGSLLIKLSNQAARGWALERCLGVVRPCGRHRLV